MKTRRRDGTYQVVNNTTVTNVKTNDYGWYTVHYTVDGYEAAPVTSKFHPNKPKVGDKGKIIVYHQAGSGNSYFSSMEVSK